MGGAMVAIVAGLATLVLVFVSVRRMWGGDPSKRSGGSGAASALADVNAMLQPQHPTADVIASAKEGEREAEDDGDPPDPGSRR